MEKKQTCPVDALLRRLSGPWTVYILYLLANEGPLRYSQLQRRISGVSPKVLAGRLKMLRDDGLVARDYRPTIPPMVSYSLTRRGVELRAMLQALEEVARRWTAEDESQQV